MARRAKAAEPTAETKAGTARKSRSTTPSRESLAALSQERLIGLVLDEVGQSAAFKKRVSAALAALQGPDSVAAMIDRRLAALEKARGFIDWQKRKAFAADLDATLATILTDLKPLDPGMALERLVRFLRGATATLERADDCNGQIHGVYEAASEAATDLAASRGPEDVLHLATSAVTWLAQDSYGLIEALLSNLIPKLSKGGLDTLEATITMEVAALMPSKPKKSGPAAFAEEEREWELRYRRQLLNRMRQRIADARGDVDGFIAIECEIAPESPDLAAIAERLLEAGRAEEALDWVRRKRKHDLAVITRQELMSGEFDPIMPEREHEEVEVRILDALGHRDEAQALRWSRFEQSLDPQILRDYLARLPDFEDEEALERALTHAGQREDPHGGLYFLIRWPHLNRAARLVTERRSEWSGQIWQVLVPAAEALAPDHPLAASILYRALIDDILQRGRSPAYGHAARHLARLGELAREMEPGSLKPDHDVYVTMLRKVFGRKSGFWSQIDA